MSYALHIPASESEIGRKEDMTENQFTPKSVNHLLTMIKQTHKWVQYTMQKMGNHISLAAIGYSQGSEPNHVTLKLNVTNHGLSD